MAWGWIHSFNDIDLTWSTNKSWLSPPDNMPGWWMSSGDIDHYSNETKNILSGDSTTKDIVFGEHLTIRLTVDGGSSTIAIFEDDVLKVSQGAGAGYGRPYANDFMLAIDEENEEACVNSIIIYPTGPYNFSADYGLPSTNSPTYSRHDFYLALQGEIKPDYQFSSVYDVIGRNGYVQFARIAGFDDGTTKIGMSGTYVEYKPIGMRIQDLTPNRVYGREDVVIYSGENTMSVKWDDSTHFMIRLSINQGDPTIIGNITFSYSLQSVDDTWYVAFLEDLEQGFARPSFIYHDHATGTYSWNVETIADATMTWLTNWFVKVYDGDTTFGESNKPQGGQTTPPIGDDPIPDPTIPPVNALNIGFFKLYWFDSSDTQKLRDLHTWMADPDTQFLNKLFDNDPLEAIIGLQLSPIAIPNSGTSDVVSFLGVDSGIRTSRIRDQFFEIDCGSIRVDYPSNHTYLDFAPYTRMKLILPFIGNLDLNPDDVMGKDIKLKYVCDAYTGTCVAHVSLIGYDEDGNPTPSTVHYSASGMFLINLPMTKKDFTQEVAAIKNAVATIATIGIAGGLTAAAGGAEALGIGSAGQVAAGAGAGSKLFNSGMDVVTSHPKYNYFSGCPDGVAAYLGVERPYLLLEIPTLARPENDQDYVGMPSMLTGTVGEFSGFTKFKEVHVENIHCTQKEQDEILEYLVNGVIIRSGSATPTPTPTAGNIAVVLLKNNSENNVIGKSWSSTTKTVEGKLLYQKSIDSPELTIEGDAIGYNYCYIPLFHRFYYIQDIVVEKNAMETLKMKSDPLQSFASAIKSCSGIAAKSADPDKINYYINDGSLTCQQNMRVITKQFVKDGLNFSFDKTAAGYVLIVAD